MANQAWQIKSPGVLELTDLGPSLPKPGPQQVLVRIGAAALNYRDKLIVDHNPEYPILAKPNLVPCIDGAGTIEQAGEGSIWKKGDRVVIFPHTWLHGNDARSLNLKEIAGAGDLDGTLKRYIVWDDTKLVRAPATLSIEEASTLITAGLTAYRALFHNALKFEPGMTVLIQGTGGVSCYAIQLASAAGATVIATSSSDEKLRIAEKLGAKHVVNYRRTPDWSGEALKATDGKGVDLIIDVVGSESIKQTLRATRYGGHIVLVGNLSKDKSPVENLTQDILFGAKTVEGQLGAGSRDMASEMSTFMEKHQIHPQIAQVFEFEQARESLEALTNLPAAGKVVVKV